MIAPQTLRESLRRLYYSKRITEEPLLKLLHAEPPKIDEEDYEFITGKKPE